MPSRSSRPSGRRGRVDEPFDGGGFCNDGADGSYLLSGGLGLIRWETPGEAPFVWSIRAGDICHSRLWTFVWVLILARPTRRILDSGLDGRL